MDNDEMEDGVLDVAGFFINDDQLVIEYTDADEEPRSVVLEFKSINERFIVEQVLQDRNFWVQIINALSAALDKETA